MKNNKLEQRSQVILSSIRFCVAKIFDPGTRTIAQLCALKDIVFLLPNGQVFITHLNCHL